MLFWISNLKIKFPKLSFDSKTLFWIEDENFFFSSPIVRLFPDRSFKILYSFCDPKLWSEKSCSLLIHHKFSLKIDPLRSTPVEASTWFSVVKRVVYILMSSYSKTKYDNDYRSFLIFFVTHTTSIIHAHRPLTSLRLSNELCFRLDFLLLIYWLSSRLYRWNHL